MGRRRKWRKEGDKKKEDGGKIGAARRAREGKKNQQRGPKSRACGKGFLVRGEKLRQEKTAVNFQR